MIPDSIRALLESRLAAGGFSIGEIRVNPGIELHHRSDAERADLEIFESPEAARRLALYDEAGKYRPLKTAPNLRRGWRMRLASTDDLRLALDYFYPAALGTWLAFLREELEPVPLRATLARQTGMYRVTQLLSDEQAEELLAATVSPEATLAVALWEIEPGKPHAFTRTRAEVLAGNPAGHLPILSAEAGNHLVAAARKIVKREPQK